MKKLLMLVLIIAIAVAVAKALGDHEAGHPS